MGHYDDQYEKYYEGFGSKAHAEQVEQLNKKGLNGLCPPSPAPIFNEGLWSYNTEYEDAVCLPEAFYDVHKVYEMGARKHGKDNYLEPNGSKSSHKEMHDSIFHHVALSFARIRLDDESGLDHLLHAASRCLMMYERIKKGIV